MKTQIVLPDLLMEDLRKFVPYRKRSQFIAKAVEKRINSMKFQKILQDVAGCWTDKNHPDLKTQKDINRYLGTFRERFRKRD
jgi:hypothetical protein